MKKYIYMSILSTALLSSFTMAQTRTINLNNYTPFEGVPTVKVYTGLSPKASFVPAGSISQPAVSALDLHTSDSTNHNHQGKITYSFKDPKTSKLIGSCIINYYDVDDQHGHKYRSVWVSICEGWELGGVCDTDSYCKFFVNK